MAQAWGSIYLKMTSEKKADLLLKGARVIDPANKRNCILDLTIKDGRISRVEKEIPFNQADTSVDLSGLLVTPGLIDMHLHAYATRQPRPGRFMASLNPDAHFPASGVTTCVDTGTAGADEIGHFRETVMDQSKTRVLAYLNIARPGMGAPEQTISNFDAVQAAEAAKIHAEVVVGIKTAHYWPSQPFDNEHPPWESVEKAVEAGCLCDMPAMIDFHPRPPDRPYSDLLLEKLRPGDIHTHVYARHIPTIDKNGKVERYMFQARERGIWFDLGHGAASFWFRNGVRAINDGFGPDSISTDLHMDNIRGPVFTMADTMSKCLIMGMSLEEVIYRSTVTPAQAIRRPELGTLSVGAEADIAVLEHQKGEFSYPDCGRRRLDGADRLVCKLTIRKGEVIYDRDAMTAEPWEEAAED